MYSYLCIIQLQYFILFYDHLPAPIQKNMKKYEEALQSLNKGLSYYSSDPEEEITDEEIIKLKSELKELLKKK